MNSEPTPGPWTVDVEMDGDEGYSITIPEIGRKLHDAEWADLQDWDRDLANAYLIAAAPELRDVVIGLMNAIETGLLVRNIENDDAPDWSIRMVHFVLLLSKAQTVLTKAAEKRNG